MIHYPRYLLIVCLIGRIEIYFYPYLAAHALYLALAIARVTARLGRPERKA